MSFYFVREDLSDVQLAALQAVSDAAVGCEAASIKSIRAAIRSTPRRFSLLQDQYGEPDGKALARCIEELEQKGLVISSVIGDLVFVGLTEDGAMCNLLEW